MMKHLFLAFTLVAAAFPLSGCSTNPATGENQFTALMSPQQEIQVGAQEHQKIMQQYGMYQNQTLQNYVSNVGNKVVENTERPDVEYKFFVLDSPMVNAFALPGGYIYTTRGLLALANNEAELAGVLSHEAGHITGRHSAERYSRGVATSLGATLIGAAIGNAQAAQALGVGANLYLTSYSRGQENESDTLGIRYMTKAGYNPIGMSGFLSSLQAEKALADKEAGRKVSASANSYFSTHPPTIERVNKTRVEAEQFGIAGLVNRNQYLNMIDGLTYGDSAEQGFVRGQSFYHPKLGFKYSVPEGFKISNQPRQIVASASSDGSAIIFDFAPNKGNLSMMTFLRETWGQGKPMADIANIKVNGMNAATGVVQGSVNKRTMNIRLVAIQWSNDQVVRFQMAMPTNANTARENQFKDSLYSFKRMSASEKRAVKPYRIDIITARSRDTVATMSNRMAQTDFREDRFRTLNGLTANDTVVSGTKYKIIVD